MINLEFVAGLNVYRLALLGKNTVEVEAMVFSPQKRVVLHIVS